MTEPWHETHCSEYARVAPQLETKYPYLHLTAKDGYTVLIGDFPLFFNDRAIDSFAVEIVIPPPGPQYAVPIVREVGGRIPHIADRHVYANGRACLFIEAEFWFKHPAGMDLVQFLDGPVTSYFVAQFAYEQTGKWPFGERAHGPEGILDFYASLVGSTNVRVIRHYVEMIVAKKLRPGWPCPCGSGSRIIDCHIDLIHHLRGRIKRSAAIASLLQLSQQTLTSRIA